jgi:hypothetical protein
MSLSIIINLKQKETLIPYRHGCEWHFPTGYLLIMAYVFITKKIRALACYKNEQQFKHHLQISHANNFNITQQKCKSNPVFHSYNQKKSIG